MSGQRADERPDGTAPGRWYGIAGIGIMLLVAVLAQVALAPTSPRTPDVPVEEFSAGRALHQLEQVADQPRPLESPGHAKARAHLLATLAGWGWRTEVQESVGATNFRQPGTQSVALVRNVVATWPGTDPTGTVVLAAHYDTVSASPGAADDGIGIGTVLEVARALSTEGAAPMRNDLVVLLTDAEEPGLLGADAFARERAAGLGESVVLNHEARGSWGAPATFRTTSPNSVLLRALSRAPGAAAESSAEVAFEALPNGTDFSALAGAGLHAVDTAIAAGGAHYHSPVDDLDHLSPASLQQMGDTSLALTRELGDSDLAEIRAGGEQVVTTLPWGLMRYPQTLEAPLALTALLGTLALVVVRRRRRVLTLPRTALAALLALLVLVLAGASGWAVWQLALRIDPGQASAVVGEPYRPTPYAIAVLLTTTAVVLTGHALVRRWLRDVTAATGALLVLAVAGALLALVPGVSGVLVLPVLCVVVAGLAAELLSPRATMIRWLLVLLGLVGATVLLGPGAWGTIEIGLASGGPVGAVLLAALLLLALPLVDDAWPMGSPDRRPVWRTAAVPGAALLLAAVLVLVGLGVNREGVTPPRQRQLTYILDTDNQSAVWASSRRPTDSWSAALLSEPPAPLDAVLPSSYPSQLSSGPAPVIDLPAPRLTLLTDRSGNGRRELALRLTSTRGAPAVGLWIDCGDAAVRELDVAGHQLPLNGSFGRWDAGFVLDGTPADGVEIRVVVDQGAEPLAVRVADRTDDLSMVPGATPPPGLLLVTPQLWVSRASNL